VHQGGGGRPDYAGPTPAVQQETARFATNGDGFVKLNAGSHVPIARNEKGPERAPGPARRDASSGACYCALLPSMLSVIVTSSPTIMPPLSSALFHLMP